MDLNTITSFRRATGREDLALAPGEIILGGGTWLFGEPQPHATGLVDLTTMGWPDLEVSEHGLRIGATCTIATLVAFAEGRTTDAVAPEDWSAIALFPVAANALLASFKIWNTATVGGNVCRSFAAGAMVSLASALDGVAEVIPPDGSRPRRLVYVPHPECGCGAHPGTATARAPRAIRPPGAPSSARDGVVPA